MESNGEPVRTATENENSRRSAGQRRVNIIWEVTQAIIAITVASTTILVAATLVLRDSAASAAFLLLSNSFFVIIGFYFGRTNHQRIGGVGFGDSGR